MTPLTVPDERRAYLARRVDRACMDHLDYVLRDELLDLMWALPPLVNDALALPQVQLLARTDSRLRAVIGMTARALAPQGDSPHVMLAMSQGEKEVRQLLFGMMMDLLKLHYYDQAPRAWAAIEGFSTRNRGVVLVSLLLFLREHQRVDELPGLDCPCSAQEGS